jgi:hypothetical protein
MVIPTYIEKQIHTISISRRRGVIMATSILRCKTCREKISDRYYAHENGEIFCCYICFLKSCPKCRACHTYMEEWIEYPGKGKFCNRYCYEGYTGAEESQKELNSVLRGIAKHEVKETLNNFISTIYNNSKEMLTLIASEGKEKVEKDIKEINRMANSMNTLSDEELYKEFKTNEGKRRIAAGVLLKKRGYGKKA